MGALVHFDGVCVCVSITQGLLCCAPLVTLIIIAAGLALVWRRRATAAAGALTALLASYCLFAGVFVWLANIDATRGGMAAGVLERFWMQVRGCAACSTRAATAAAAAAAVVCVCCFGASQVGWRRAARSPT